MLLHTIKSLWQIKLDKLITDYLPGKSGSSLVMVTIVRVYGWRKTPGDIVRIISNVSFPSGNVSSTKGREIFLASCLALKKTSSDVPPERSMSSSTIRKNNDYNSLILK